MDVSVAQEYAGNWVIFFFFFFFELSKIICNVRFLVLTDGFTGFYQWK